MKRVSHILSTLLAVFPGTGLLAQEQPFELDIGGLLFGDLYYLPSHHSETGDGAAGAVLRRGYLTFNAQFGEQWRGRLRFELNQDGAFETYRYRSQVKDLYLQRKLGRHTVTAGLTSTIAYDLIESVWGKRYLARTPLDLQGVPSRDVGVSLKGPLSPSGTLSYRAMVGLGVEFEADGNENDKWMVALTWRPAERWLVDVYYDSERVDGPRDRVTGQVFMAYQAEGFRWGAQYSNQDRENDPSLKLASAFIVKSLDDRSSLIGRIDRLLEPSPRGDRIAYLPYDPSAKATTLFAGFEYALRPNWRLTPNVVWTRYDRNDDGIHPDDDLHLRLTLFADFE